jgi:hypothetical protein
VKNILNFVTVGGFILFGFLLIIASCRNSNPKQAKESHHAYKRQVYGFLSVDIKGSKRTFLQNKEGNSMELNYKPLSRQLSVKAENADGSVMELSFHSVDKLNIGSFPSLLNDQGIKSWIYYRQSDDFGGTEFSSVTYAHPVQENTIKVIRIDRSNKKAYLIEGVFSATMYPADTRQRMQVLPLSNGHFRVFYHPDEEHPLF